MAARIQTEHLQLGPNTLVRPHFRQARGCDVEAVGLRECKGVLAFQLFARACMEVGDGEQHIATGYLRVAAQFVCVPDAVERVEPAGQSDVFGGGAAGACALPEVGDRREWVGIHDARHLVVGDACHVGQGEPDAPATVDVFGAVASGGYVDVEAQYRNPHLPRFFEQQPFRVHARIVSEDAGKKMRRVVPLQPR